MMENSKFKHSLEIRGSHKNLSSFIKELKELGYKEYEGSNPTGDILAVGPTSGSILKDNYYGLFYDKINRREFCFDIDDEKQKQAALCIAAIKEGNELSKGELIFVEGRNAAVEGRNAAFIFDYEMHNRNRHCYYYSHYLINGEDKTETNPEERNITNEHWILNFKKATPQQIIGFFMENKIKKVTGFKLLKDTPAVKAGAKGWIDANKEVVFKGVDVGIKRDGEVWDEDYYSIDYCLNNTEWFEPLYEPEKVVLNVGSNNIEVVIQGSIIEAHDKIYDIKTLRDIYDYYSHSFNDTFGGYGIYVEYDIRFIRIGCIEENHLFSLADLGTVILEYNKINNV